MPADLSVVICSRNGAAGVGRCLRALAGQTISTRLEIIVVDDGSIDSTSAVASRYGATVIRHAVNRGRAAARNSGLHVASAPVVAFLDDDCEPEPKWAEQLLAAYTDNIAGVSGAVVPSASPGAGRAAVAGFLFRNPIQPVELNLAGGCPPSYRLRLSLARWWTMAEGFGQRYVSSLTGPNMSFRRQVLFGAGGFDERFDSGADDVDACQRISRAYPALRFAYVPDATVIQHVEASLPATLRGSRSAGRGAARLYRTWPGARPSLHAGPVLVAALLAASVRFPLLAVAALAVPQLLYPRGLRAAMAARRARYLLDAYIRLAQEASADAGFIEGWWRFRHLVPAPASGRPRFVPYPAQPKS